MKINPLFATDFYKIGHINQYPENTTLVYSNLTPRSFKNWKATNAGIIDGLVVFGLQAVIRSYLIDTWNEGFFNLPKNQVISRYRQLISYTLGKEHVSSRHLEALHDLGYLPIEIKALPEGSVVQENTPIMTIKNTLPEFFWLVNFLETALSAELWKPATVATIAREYHRLLLDYADLTGVPYAFVKWQGHDFASRGMSGIHDDAASNAGHLLSFYGTDSILSIDHLIEYYGADIFNETIGCSVPATEHSVMCMGTKENELETFNRLITKIYPKGVISIVSDTWDFWKVISEYSKELKETILNRDGKVVFRPDSGDPVKIICGDEKLEGPAGKGAVEVLWDIFGGTVNEKGYKVLDPHVGLIYGDSITLDRAASILFRLKKKRFASSNIVFGIGSYTYQYVTRDSFGFAVKSTYGEINGIGQEIFKDPITDSGVKKSHKGLLRVEKENGKFVTYQSQTWEQEQQGCLKTVFKDGEMKSFSTLKMIRERLENWS